jgi:hypothetical protein
MLTLKANVSQIKNSYSASQAKTFALPTTVNYTNRYTNKHYWMFLLM